MTAPFRCDPGGLPSGRRNFTRVEVASGQDMTVEDQARTLVRQSSAQVSLGFSHGEWSIWPLTSLMAFGVHVECAPVAPRTDSALSAELLQLLANQRNSVMWGKRPPLSVAGC